MLIAEFALWAAHRCRSLRQREVQFDEVRRSKLAWFFASGNRQGSSADFSLGDSVGEGFLIGKQLRALDIIEQRGPAEYPARGAARFCRLPPGAFRAHQGDQSAADRQACREQGKVSGTTHQYSSWGVLLIIIDGPRRLAIQKP